MATTENMDQSILDSVKKIIGNGELDDYFDQDLCFAINSVLMQANRMGLVCDDFSIVDSNKTWKDILLREDQINLHALISWTALRVRLLFDPPTSATLMNSIKEEAARLEWYIYTTENYVGEIQLALSNTAVPIYYGQFRNAVLRGEIPICDTIEMEMHRIDDNIANPGIYYDDRAIEGFIKFCERELVLTNGGDLKLLDTFKLWAEEIFGWYYFVERSIPVPNPNGHGATYVKKYIKKRLVNLQYLIVPRRAAKSMYGACLQAYELLINTDSTGQITVAPTMRQAEEVMSPIRLALTRARGPFLRMMTAGSLQNTTGNRADRQKVASTKKGIQNFLTGSILEVRPMSIDKLQGGRIKLATLDEWLSGDIRENPINAIQQGCTKQQGAIDDPNDYLIVAISSEGTVRNGIGDTIKMELLSILRGDYINPHVSIFYYKLDSIDEVGKPEMWLKANPNLGKTVTYEDYQLDVEKAEKNPADRNEILAKIFNLPLEGYTYYFRYEEILPHSRRSFRGMPCALGADLSRGDDFCAFTFLFPLRNGTFGVKARSYITSYTFQKLPLALRDKYETFIREGSLQIMEGTVLDMGDVYEDVDQHIVNMQYDVRSFGYDPYNAETFVNRWAQENGPFGIEKVIQGAKTESVPLGELKKYAEQRALIFDESIMEFCMGNCIILKDTNGNKKLYKRAGDEKIDNVAALMDAYISWKLNKEAFE